MTTLHIATATDLDVSSLYAILRLRSEVFVVEQGCAYQDMDGRDLETATRHLWLTTEIPAPAPVVLHSARTDAQSGMLGVSGAAAIPDVLACLRILHESLGVVRIGRVCVSPRARRLGYGGRLLAAALVEIGDQDAVLNAQVYAAGLYAAAGFVQDGAEFDEDGIPHIPMRRLASIPPMS